MLKSDCGAKSVGVWKWGEGLEDGWWGERGGGSIGGEEMDDMERKRKDRSKSLRSCRDANGGIFRVLE